MSPTATIDRRTMDDKHFEPDEQMKSYLESLSATELRELASYARKMAVGKESPEREPGSEGGRWLVAHYVRGSGPYFYLQSYQTGDRTYTNERGHMVSGKRKTKYVGRRLPADLAEEFGYAKGTTPEETEVHITGTPRQVTARKRSKKS